ncbi:MAG: response regulator [Deltaproteobacteria bacterium]|nr:response regulator [Deltaproteobacteria bacterium]
MKNSLLIVDDSITTLKWLRQILKREGYDVLEASNGKEGLRLCHQEWVDLVITDLIMPDKEGLETIMELRRDFPHVPIIAMSGGGRISPEEYLYLAKKLGAQHTLCKPFTRQEILRAIRDVLDKGLEL